MWISLLFAIHLRKIAYCEVIFIRGFASIDFEDFSALAKEPPSDLFTPLASLPLEAIWRNSKSMKWWV